jgi:DNA replication protein DnaD
MIINPEPDEGNADHRVAANLTDELFEKFMKKQRELNLSKSGVIIEALIQFLDPDILFEKTIKGLDLELERQIASVKVLLTKKEMLVNQRAEEAEEAKRIVFRQKRSSDIREKIDAMDKQNLDEIKLHEIMKEINNVAAQTDTTWKEINELVGRKQITAQSLYEPNFRELSYKKK